MTSLDKSKKIQIGQYMFGQVWTRLTSLDKFEQVCTRLDYFDKSGQGWTSVYNIVQFLISLDKF